MSEPTFQWKYAIYRWGVCVGKRLYVTPREDGTWQAWVKDKYIGRFSSAGEAQQALEHEWLKRNGYPEGAAHGGAKPIEPPLV